MYIFAHNYLYAASGGGIPTLRDSRLERGCTERNLTGNPLIYCHKRDVFNEIGKSLAKGFYWTHSWNDVEVTLNMLKSGKDPLKEKREQIIKNDFYLPEKGAGFEIKEFLKRDFYKK